MATMVPADWEYREHPPPADLRTVLACTWEQRPAAAHEQLVVPDGCIDLIWLADEKLVVAGPDTGPRTVALPAGRLTSGARLRPGVAGAFLRMPADEVRDNEAAGADVLGAVAAELAGRLEHARPAARLALLCAAVRDRRVRPDPVVTAAARLLGLPGTRVAGVAWQLGLSERQLHRRTVAAAGYSPVMLARVLRLGRLSRANAGSLAERALSCGYASQSHMSDEVRALTGLTPARYLARFEPQ